MPLIVSRKQDVLMEYLSNFYSERNNLLEDFIKIISPDSKISLRVIDWFVTNYSKKYNIMYEISCKDNSIIDPKDSLKETNKRQFIVYLNYKSQLKSYSKKQFDPFCRRERISYEYLPGKEVTTTVGQLNFFKWAMENSVIEYIAKHSVDIERDMLHTMRKNSPKGKKLKERKDKNYHRPQQKE